LVTFGRSDPSPQRRTERTGCDNHQNPDDPLRPRARAGSDAVTELAAAFEEHRGHLRLVAHRMLGSATEADDAVHEAWIKLSRVDAGAIENLRGWLTTVVARVCLDMLRSRTSRREDPLATAPEPVVPSRATLDRELADSVGLALLVVLDKLDPAERLAF